MQSLFFLIFMIFESESSEKSIFTDKLHESVICDIWAYTNNTYAKANTTPRNIFFFFFVFWAKRTKSEG